MLHRFDTKPLILVVDDEPINLNAMKQILEDEYELLFSTSGKEVVSLAKAHRPNLILLDVLMGESNGFDICKSLKSNSKTERIPVIFITILNDIEDEESGFEVGAVDYISKPIKPPILKARIKTHLSLVRAKELKESQLEIIRRLGVAAEFKSDETSSHIIRMSHYARKLALEFGCDENWAEDLFSIAPMHDIGKIGIPDNILHKPGKLTPAEWEKMQKHCQIGADIIGNHDNKMLQMARTIALEHHEKWDGSGYPNRLVGEEISLSSRIIALADVFDALTSKRCYKDAWTIEAALEFIQKQSGLHFDPKLVSTFCSIKSDLIQIRQKYQDKE